MSVRSLKFFPSGEVIRPIEIPATGSFIGTPPSIKAKVEAETAAIEVEPFEDKASETRRMVYGNSSFEVITGSSDFSAKAPWPISRRPGKPTRPVSPDEKGGK